MALSVRQLLAVARAFGRIETAGNYSLEARGSGAAAADSVVSAMQECQRAIL